jgi:hypothetical protein
MSSLTYRIAISAAAARSVAIAALLGIPFLASPLTAARADSAAIAPVELTQTTFHQAAAEAGQYPREDRRALDRQPSRGAGNHARRGSEVERRRSGDA